MKGVEQTHNDKLLVELCFFSRELGIGDLDGRTFCREYTREQYFLHLLLSTAAFYPKQSINF